MIGLTLATGIYLLGGYCGVTIFGGGLFVDASLALGSGTTLYAGALEKIQTGRIKITERASVPL